ncbi:MAG: hypothetical protein AAFQ64_04875 [Pseudomonadota bacterium]
MRLSTISANQLSELAMHYDRTMDQAAMIAIHIAYLGHLEEKRDAAMQALNMALGNGEPDDELPF